MSGEYLPFPLSIRKKVGWILDEAWQGGNFGFYDPRFVNGKNEPWEKRDHVWQAMVPPCKTPFSLCTLGNLLVSGDATLFPDMHEKRKRCIVSENNSNGSGNYWKVTG